MFTRMECYWLSLSGGFSFAGISPSMREQNTVVGEDLIAPSRTFKLKQYIIRRQPSVLDRRQAGRILTAWSVWLTIE